MTSGKSPVIALRRDHGGITAWLSSDLTGRAAVAWAANALGQVPFLTASTKISVVSRGLFEVTFGLQAGAYGLDNDQLAHVNDVFQPQCLAIVGGENRVVRGSDRVHIATTTHLTLSHGSFDHVPAHSGLVVDGEVTVTDNTVIFAMPNPSRDRTEVDAFVRRVAAELRLHIPAELLPLAKSDLEAEHIRALDYRPPAAPSAPEVSAPDATP